MSTLPLISHHLFVSAASMGRRPRRPQRAPRSPAPPEPRVMEVQLELVPETAGFNSGMRPLRPAMAFPEH